MKNKLSPQILLAAVLFLICNYLVFIYAPTEVIMGDVQRVFYFHVGSAFAAYLALAIVFCSSLAYLNLKNEAADNWARSSGEVALLFCTLVLGSGMIWGKAAWGTWFSWEPRLVTFLLLWFSCFAYVILREFSLNHKISELAAVLGVIMPVMVPVMVYSIKYLPAFQQLHPVVVERGGLSKEMNIVFIFCSLSFLYIAYVLINIRKKMLELESLFFKGAN